MSMATEPQPPMYVLEVLPIEKPRVLISGLQGAPRQSNPYQPVGDFLSNVGRFKIIESTLRGQFPIQSMSFCFLLLTLIQRENNSPIPTSTPRPRSRCWFPKSEPQNISLPHFWTIC